MAVNDVQRADMDLRSFVKSLCAPIWWEQGRQTVVNSGSMCVLKTPEALIGITNNHVLKIYEKHKAERHDIFCQLGGAPFDPTANLIACSKYWDLAIFRIPALTLRHWGHRVFEPVSWPPAAITMEDHCVYGGYPEYRRQVPPGPNPPTMTADFVSFRANPHGCSDRNVSFQVDTAKLTWLPNVTDPLREDADLSGMSGGPCFRIIGAENRIEYAGVIYEGRWDIGIIFSSASVPDLCERTDCRPATLTNRRRQSIIEHAPHRVCTPCTRSVWPPFGALPTRRVDAGHLGPELAAGIRRVKRVRRIGVRLGNWLTPAQGRRLLESATPSTVRETRDHAMVAKLIGCGLRRAELLALTNQALSDQSGTRIPRKRLFIIHPPSGAQESGILLV